VPVPPLLGNRGDHSEGEEVLPGVVEKTFVNFDCALSQRPSRYLRKPWLTIVLDDYSRAVAGSAIYFAAPSAIQTALALHQAIWRKAHPGWQICGIPEILYSDHGSDFTSRHLEQVAADLKIRLMGSRLDWGKTVRQGPMIRGGYKPFVQQPSNLGDFGQFFRS
jgi:transposase InsO family protein